MSNVVFGSDGSFFVGRKHFSKVTRDCDNCEQTFSGKALTGTLVENPNCVLHFCSDKCREVYADMYKETFVELVTK